MQGANSAAKAIERVDIINGVREIVRRLRDINGTVDRMRGDILGEGESCGSDGPERVPNGSLDGMVADVFPLLSDIESGLERLNFRIGVGANCPAPSKLAR